MLLASIKSELKFDCSNRLKWSNSSIEFIGAQVIFFCHLIQFFSIRSRYKGRPIYTSRYQEAGGSSVPTSSGSRETLRSTSQLASSGSAPSEARPSPSSASYTAPATQSSQGLGLNISSFLLTTSNQ